MMMQKYHQRANFNILDELFNKDLAESSFWRIRSPISNKK